MRYLIHSEDATFDTDTGKYTFSLDRRISDPRRIRINSAAYIAPTMATYPQVVYLRSSKLSEAVRRKHTVELKDNSHENATDTLCVLHETHTTGRYNMDTQSKRNFAVHSHLPLRKIDFYFTNNRTNLGATPAPAGVTDEDVLGISNLIFFLDWDHAASIDPNPISQNEDIMSITSRLSPDNYVFATTGSGIVYSPFGETNSMLSTVAYKYALDSTTAGNVDEGSTACLTMMFRTKDGTPNSWSWLFKSPLFQLLAGEPLGSSNNLGYYDADSSLWGNTSLVIEGGTDYLLQVKKSSNTFSWLLRDLVTEAEQTEDTGDTAATGTDNAAFYLSNGQTGFNGLKISHAIEFLSVTEADCLAVKNWMLQKYTGEDVEGEVGDASNNATFFVEMNIKTRNVGR